MPNDILPPGAGMPLLEAMGLSPTLRRFVESYVEHGDTKRAAAEADLRRDPYALLRSAQIQLAISAEISRRIKTDGAGVGWRVLRTIANNASVAPGVRVDAAKTLLRLAGHVEPVKAADGGAKHMADMSQDELRHVIDVAEGELAVRSKDVTAPIPPPATDEAVDIFG